MTSLKLFAPVLSELTGLSSVAIYERQRALIRTGVLPTPVGRGRGNGLLASAETVSWLLIAMMVTDNLSETDARIRKWGSAKFNKTRDVKACRLTRKTNLYAAVATLLSSAELASSVRYLEISRVSVSGEILYSDKGPIRYEQSNFGSPVFERINFEVNAKMSGYVFREIAEALQQGPREKQK